MKRVRLIQMVMQPVLVADDGESLVPLDVQPITVSAADWPTFATEKWPEMISGLTEQVNTD